jgi:hypothetical protein
MIAHLIVFLVLGQLIGGAMKRTGSPKVKGVFERPVGSGSWWINYYVDGKQYREKVGRRSDALALYQKRKADARRKVKLPELVRGKTVTFGQLSEMAVQYTETHLVSPDHYRTKDSIPERALRRASARYSLW